MYIWKVFLFYDELRWNWLKYIFVRVFFFVSAFDIPLTKTFDFDQRVVYVSFVTINFGCSKTTFLPKRRFKRFTLINTYRTVLLYPASRTFRLCCSIAEFVLWNEKYSVACKSENFARENDVSSTEINKNTNRVSICVCSKNSNTVVRESVLSVECLYILG